MPAIDERGPFRAAAGSFRFANGTDVAELYFVRTAVTLKVLGHFVPSAADDGLWGAVSRAYWPGPCIEWAGWRALGC